MHIFNYKIVNNSPALLGFIILCTVVLILDTIFSGKLVNSMFSVYREQSRWLHQPFRYYKTCVRVCVCVCLCVSVCVCVWEAECLYVFGWCKQRLEYLLCWKTPCLHWKTVCLALTQQEPSVLAHDLTLLKPAGICVCVCVCVCVCSPTRLLTVPRRVIDQSCIFN